MFHPYINYNAHFSSLWCLCSSVLSRMSAGSFINPLWVDTLALTHFEPLTIFPTSPVSLPHCILNPKFWTSSAWWHSKMLATLLSVLVCSILEMFNTAGARYHGGLAPLWLAREPQLTYLSVHRVLAQPHFCHSKSDTYWKKCVFIPKLSRRCLDTSLPD